MSDTPDEVREYFRRIAEEGDYPSKGGKARAKKLTKEQRKEAARKAVNARWAKAKKAAKKGPKK